MQRQAVILCEGFDDRAFLAEWLVTLGCQQARRDPWGSSVTNGQYGFTAPGGRFVRVHPCDGKGRLAEIAGTYIDRHPARSVSRLMLCFDPDCEAPAVAPRGAVLQSVAAKRSASLPSDAGVATIDGVEVVSMAWECDDPADVAGVPSKQCLERLVAAAIVATEPARGASVAGWLQAPPVTAGPEHKAHAYAYLAKWFARSGFEDFYRAVWRDLAIRSELEARLRRSGSLKLVHEMMDA
jgi:hypothetical protein